MVALGKVINPMTGKAEKNLSVARLFIDTLEMLENKTRGNLNSDETKVLQATLTDLRLMFVEESKQGQSAKDEGQKTDSSADPSAVASAKEEAPAKAVAGTPSSGEAAPSDPSPTDESKVKFHKKYES